MGRMHDALNKAAAQRDQLRGAADPAASAGSVAARESWRVDEGVIAFHAPQDRRCEEFRRLRTALQRMNPAPRVVTLAGLRDQQASALVIANLAASFAEGGGCSVLLVDGSMRDGGLDALLAGRSSPGFAEALAQGFSSDLVQTTGVPGVSLLAAGSGAAGGLMQAGKITGVMAQVRSGWDMVLVHAPALQDSADAEVLSAATDGLVLVIRIGADSVAVAEQNLERLRRNGVQVLGAVSANCGG